MQREDILHILHCTPLGSSMFREYIRCLQEAGREGRGARMALVLPSPYLLEQARTELRLAEPPVREFPRVLSLDQLAANLSGLRKISRMEQEILIDGIVKESSGNGRVPYFEKIVEFPGFVASLARLFDEFKMADVTPEQLEIAIDALAGEVERNAGRDAEIAGLFHAYQCRLEEYSLVDLGGMYRRAMETLEQQDRALPFDHIFMAEFSVLSPLRLQLLERLKRQATMEIGICYEKNRPHVFRAVEPVYQALVGMNFSPRFHEAGNAPVPALQHMRRELFADQPGALKDAVGIQVLYCPNRAKEMSVTADRIKSMLLQESYRPQEVAVVVNDPGAYSRLHSVFSDRGIPVDQAESSPVQERSLPRLVFSWLEMLRHRGSRATVFAVLKSPYVRDKLGWDVDELEKCLLSEVIRNWEDWMTAMTRQAPEEAVGEKWRQGWNELQQRVKEGSGAASWTDWAARVRNLLVWLDAPTVLGRRRREGTLSLFEVRAELESLESILGAMDQMEQMAALLQQNGEKTGPGDLAEILRRVLSEATVNLSERQDTGVQVVTPETASGMNFRAVFVLGLAEGKFPAPPRESWLYNDRERRTLGEVGVCLSTSEDRTAAADFAFSLAAGMATEQLVLSAVTDSETLPSRFFTEVMRLFDRDAIVAETFGLHQVVAVSAEAIRSPRELMKAALHNVWCEPAPSGEWNDIYSAIHSSLPFELEKKAPTEANRMGSYAGEIDPELLEDSRYSASALEQYADCPFAYFVGEVLGLAEWDEAQEGFDALSAGSIWHEILAAFLSRYRGRKLDSNEEERYAQELIDLLDAAVTRRERQGRVVPDVWWRFEKPRWEKALRNWLAGELDRQSKTELTPSFFEWAFGANFRKGCDPASVERPLVLTGDENIELVELQGKVDRIDCGGEHLRIMDYKTGKPPSRRQVEQGLRLQVPLYMMAAEALLGKQGETSADGLYVQVGAAASELGLPGAKISREELLEISRQSVLRYVAGIRRGKFPPQPAEECPSWCRARTFCRREAAPDGEETEEATDE